MVPVDGDDKGDGDNDMRTVVTWHNGQQQGDACRVIRDDSNGN